MATIFDYIKKKGHLSFTEFSFNNVDALILSIVSYLPFEDIITINPYKKKTIEASFEQLNKKKLSIINTLEYKLFDELAKCIRFKYLLLSCYINEIDYANEKQFAAILIDTTDKSHFISYRGTDNTIIGWKEDFKMSFLNAVPAQIRAISYLEKIAASFSGDLRLGGHSKGGNLAVYAASFCHPATQNRIIKIYNNDGPGFSVDTISKQGYQRVKHKINTFIPQSSIVGMLFEHEEEYIVVHSTQIGLFQHYPFSWEIQEDDFMYLDKVNQNSQFIDRTIKYWANQLEPWQKEKVVDSLFDIFKNTEIKTITDLRSNWYPNVLYIIKAINKLDNPSKKLLIQTLQALLKSAKMNIRWK